MIRYFSLSFLRRSVLLLKNFEEKEREREKRVEKFLRPKFKWSVENPVSFVCVCSTTTFPEKNVGGLFSWDFYTSAGQKVGAL